MLSCPHPSRGFGIFCSPISSAPLTNNALIRSDPGVNIPTSSLKNSLAIADAPATTGVAIELPFIVMYIGVEPSGCNEFEQFPPVARSASWALAEHTITPGATKSGFILPSEVGPVDDSAKIDPIGSDSKAPVVEAPTESAFFAVLGEETPETPISPAEKTTRNSG